MKEAEEKVEGEIEETRKGGRKGRTDRGLEGEMERGKKIRHEEMRERGWGEKEIDGGGGGWKGVWE